MEYLQVASRVEFRMFLATWWINHHSGLWRKALWFSTRSKSELWRQS